MSRDASAVITRLSGEDLCEAADGFAGLLLDAVEGGASLGFLASLDRAGAAAWWRALAPAVEAGELMVWAVRGPDGIDGTISLAFERKANGRHRAEIVKLMVRRRARGRGLGRALLAAAESAAAAAGVTLLLLDTETGSAADHLYRAEGWTPYGLVPGYASDPGGILRDCSFFYKNLNSADQISG